MGLEVKVHSVYAPMDVVRLDDLDAEVGTI